MNQLRRIKLRHLETFVEVARQKSVSRAADALNLTQPAVTRTLRELEEICGKPLVEKEGRGIRISHYGEIFLRYAGSSITAARNGVNALSELSLDDGPRIRLGALPTVAATIIPQAVSRYLQSGMRNRLKVVTGENRVLLDQLRNGELDLVMGRLPAPENMQGLVFEPTLVHTQFTAGDFDTSIARAFQLREGDLTQSPCGGYVNLRLTQFLIDKPLGGIAHQLADFVCIQRQMLRHVARHQSGMHAMAPTSNLPCAMKPAMCGQFMTAGLPASQNLNLVRCPALSWHNQKPDVAQRMSIHQAQNISHLAQGVRHHIMNGQSGIKADRRAHVR